jgi:hypothetical protein
MGREMTFKPGDLVRMNSKAAGRYSITVPGVIGYIVENISIDSKKEITFTPNILILTDPLYKCPFPVLIECVSYFNPTRLERLIYRIA